MTALRDLSSAWPNLGPATEALLAETFAGRVMIPANATCRVLGVDEKTLGALVEGGAVRFVLVGKNTKRFTEADLRAYLSRETELQCLSTSRQTAVSGNTTSSRKVVAFTALRALKASGRPNR